MTHFKTLLVPALLLGLFGCDKVAVEDNMDQTDFLFDFDLLDFGPRENDLNGPYAAGTYVEFRAVGADDTTGWTYQSDNEEVIEVMLSSNGFGSLRANSSGVAHIQLVDSGGDCVEEFDVEVAEVAEVAVTSNAIIKSEGEVGNNMAGETLYVLEGGNATFRAVFLDSTGRELRGRDILEVRGEAAETSMTEFGTLSAWITIAPFTAGTETLELTIDGRNVGTLNVGSVAPDALEGIRIVGDELSVQTGEQVVIRATGVVGSNAVYGTEPAWDSMGMNLGVGDLYSYTYDADQETTVRAAFAAGSAELEDSIVVHGELGTVSSSANLGCSAGGGAGGFGALFPLGLGLLFLRRRL